MLLMPLMRMTPPFWMLGGTVGVHHAGPPPQRTNRIEPRRATRGQPGGQRAGAEQHHRDSEQRNRIRRRNAIEQRCRQHAERQRGRARREADRAHRHATPKHDARTDVGVAPNAMRTPISRVRCAVT